MPYIRTNLVSFIYLTQHAIRSNKHEKQYTALQKKKPFELETIYISTCGWLHEKYKTIQIYFMHFQLHFCSFFLSPYVHVHSDRNVSKTLLIKISFVFLSIAEIWKHISEPKFRVQDFIHIHTRTPRDTFKRNI